MEQVNFQVALEALRKEYARNLPTRVADIENAWRALSPGTWVPDEFATFVRLAHSLGGSGATFGFMEVSGAARALELYARGLSAAGYPDTTQCCEIEALLSNLRSTIEMTSNGAALATTSNPTTTPQWSATNTVWLYEPDAQVSEELANSLAQYGYQVRILGTLDLCESELATLPIAFVVNWDAARRAAQAGMDVGVLVRLHRTEPSLPIVFLAEQDDIVARLEAVRHGAAVLLAKPVSVATLVETLDSRTGSRTTDPFRILIVDDDSGLAAYAAAALDAAGMVTRIVLDPLQVMEPLLDFRPDLILTDVHMPHLSGLELAEILRQQESFVGTPIVFLSSESDPNMQLSALLLGGDDFLLKPIAPHHLVSSVTSRVQRARILQALAERDGLTGLINHVHLKEKLAIEVARSLRENSEMAYVMLDIDRFKGINDLYGHPTGDRVLKSLARLMKRRLRQSDVLGRYGGEEFAVIMPATNAHAAFAVMEEMREMFANVRQHARGVEFNVTFSAGIATTPPWMEAVSLNDAADRALYHSKRSGRNQVSCATE